MATPGQGSFIPFSLLNLASATLQVTDATTMRCAEFWTKVPYTLNLNYVVAHGQTADATNYFGFAIYASAGNRITGATSTGQHVAAGMETRPTLHTEMERKDERHTRRRVVSRRHQNRVSDRRSILALKCVCVKPRGKHGDVHRGECVRVTSAENNDCGGNPAQVRHAEPTVSRARS